ncbi:hypothetical protein N4P33_19490 [Streptomyces sp. 15-116A]|uniref:hypothetical protein n=1 Tax=Streptomyces sp. 15-116A TaxID=2259035 RepID=UPI0021B3B130|nr:hypothetical protein [Streptomyces sp. 15-116A]MCT7354318.1 hypothetical protein [Streptomyces sp. 15-116A]
MGMDHWPYPPGEADRVELFDAVRSGPQYVLFGGQRPSYAFTDPGRFDDPELHRWIPWGYKILWAAQKVAVLRHGEVVREWPVLHRDPRVDPVDPPEGETLYLDNWRRSVCGYRVLTSPAAMVTPQDAYDPGAAMALARTASRTEGRALVVYLYDARDWH